MAGLEPETDGERAGVRKKRRREKKRQWVWTIGTNGDDDGDEKEHFVSTPMRVAELPPTPIVEKEDVEDFEEPRQSDNVLPLAMDAEPQEIHTEIPPDQSEDTEMVDRLDKSGEESR